jgi:triphosphatase
VLLARSNLAGQRASQVLGNKTREMPEIELKFAATPADMLAAKRQLLVLAGRARVTRATLISVYYDTADLQLKQHGLTLRVRERNRRFVQTVKAENPASALPIVRGEWEDSLRHPLPDLNAPNSGARLPAGLTATALQPVFSAVIRRAVIPLKLGGGTEIEAALDEGEITANGGRLRKPVCEIELEHRCGDPSVLYEIGLRLVEAAPLRIEMRSKSERGFDLNAGGPTLEAVHASPAPLEPGMTVEATLERFGSDCLALVLRNESAALAGSAEGLHQMRVAIRRLRAVLNTLKRMLPDEQYGWANEELRWLARELGPARNWDVFVDSVVGSVNGKLLRPEDLKTLIAVARQEQARARQAAHAAIRSKRYTTRMLRLLQWFTARKWREQSVSEPSAQLMAPISEVASGLVARRHKQVSRAVRDFAHLDMEGRHRVRIALKKLRYTVDLLQSLFAKDAVAQYMRLLKPLQDELGHANDVRVARDLIAELSGNGCGGTIDRAAGIVLGWHDRGLADHEPKLLKRLDKLHRAKPFW